MTHLPPELLHEVFDRIKSNKSHLSPCLLVCKSWYFTAQLFFPKEIKIITNDSNLQRLKADLIQYPAIASKIDKITLDETSFGNQPPELLIETIGLAPNLIDLNFASTNVCTYLSALSECPYTTLSSIQKISIYNMKYSKPSLRHLHFMVNYRFRKTIKNLEITAIADDSAIYTYAGLSKVIKEFPSLTHIKGEAVVNGVRDINVDVLTLIDASPMLEVIKLYNFQNVSIPNATEQLNYTRVKKLKIKAIQLDIQTLHIIYTQFPNLNSLRVIATRLTSDPGLSLSEAKNILKSFEEYSKTLARANISIVYLQEPPILLDIGKRNPRLYFPHAHLFGNIPDNFMHELLMMHDEWLAHEDNIDLYDGMDAFEDEFDRFHEFHEFDENIEMERLDELMDMNEEEMMFGDEYLPDEDDEYDDEFLQRMAEEEACVNQKDVEFFQRMAEEEACINQEDDEFFQRMTEEEHQEEEEFLQRLAEEEEYLGQDDDEFLHSLAEEEAYQDQDEEEDYLHRMAEEEAFFDQEDEEEYLQRIAENVPEDDDQWEVGEEIHEEYDHVEEKYYHGIDIDFYSDQDNQDEQEYDYDHEYDDEQEHIYKHDDYYEENEFDDPHMEQFLGDDFDEGDF